MNFVREVRVGPIDWGAVEGAAAVVPVRVDWPELRLTEEQVLANAVARAAARAEPFPDPAVFAVRIERPWG